MFWKPSLNPSDVVAGLTNTDLGDEYLEKAVAERGRQPIFCKVQEISGDIDSAVLRRDVLQASRQLMMLAGFLYASERTPARSLHEEIRAFEKQGRPDSFEQLQDLLGRTSECAGKMKETILQRLNTRQADASAASRARVPRL